MESNYSQKIQKVLKKENIDIGSQVQVISKGQAYEGILMPRIEAGDVNSLILKLQNGYNIGVEFANDVKIKKVGDIKKLGVIPTKKFIPKDNLPNISMIATGGTIGTHIDYLTGGVFMCRTPEEILSTTPEIENIANIKSMLRPFTIASEDMIYKDWQNLAEIVAKELNSTGISGAIITHGTDTLHFTSAALSFMLKDLNKPVAVIGAQRSPDRGSFDGALNLICGSYFAGHSDVAEVSVVMHGTPHDTFCHAHRGTKVRKMHTSRRDAFQSINDLPIAKIWPNGRIEITNKDYRKRNDGKVMADTKFEPKVALIKFYNGSDPQIIDWYVDRGYKGIVVEGTGLGHVATAMSGVDLLKDRKKISWIPNIKKAVDRGVTVVMTSQTLFGRVNPFVYRNLRLVHNLGVIYGEDMLPEVAYIKLGWVLGHTKDKEKIKELMLRNIAGEIRHRSELKTFPPNF